MKALVSVSNKEGIVELGKELDSLGIEILSTGGTAKALTDAGIKVTDVSDYTGSPEMMDGRVKTLHPKVHGGILALRSNDEHLKQAEENGISLIDLVIVNLYPFEATVKSGAGFEEVIENIDIGGPSMVRSAAKNFESVAVVVDPNDYSMVIDELKKEGITKETKQKLSVKAFQHTAKYDSIISDYLQGKTAKEEFPDSLTLTYDKVKDCRYGENPHQRGAVYKEPMPCNETSITNCEVVMEGKPLSFNNYLDGDAAFELVKDFSDPTVAVIKHCNPCGIASRDDIVTAFTDAYDVDAMSAYGCVIAMNKDCDMNVAELTKGKYIEVLIAPSFTDDAVAFIKENKKNIRLLATGPITKCDDGYNLKRITGGLLVQSREWPDIDGLELEVKTKRAPTEAELDDLKFAWKVNKHTKSNSVVFCKDKTAYGLGVGQMSRVDSSLIAVRKADGRAEGGVVSSDAFFPFRDAVDAAHKAGVKAIIQPGGSIRDEEVIDACNEHDIAMVFSGVRLFKH